MGSVFQGLKTCRKIFGVRWTSNGGVEADLRSLVLQSLREIERDDFRVKFAPWIPIGEYNKELMSHLETPEIIRAALVLHLCNYNIFVNRSQQLFQLSQKLGPLSAWFLRKTFFNQFVGGDTVPQMKRTADLMHQRGLSLMLLPVLEADVADAAATSSQLDANATTLENLIKMTSDLEKEGPVFQLKASAIIPLDTLQTVTNAIVDYLSRKGSSAQNLAHVVDEFANSIDSSNGGETKNVLGLKKIDKDNMVNGLQRADKLAKLAKKLSIRILVDAEFVSCKQGISLLAYCLMARHNERDAHFVGNTIQTYLKNAVSTAEQEWELITNVLGVNWAGKVVRGAYIDRERQLAESLQCDSPVCVSYEETNKSYNRTISSILENIANGKRKCHLTIASHNERSIRLAAHLMKEFGLGEKDNVISFAQVYGMADYLSTPLVRGGYKVYKSTPYGPMESVLLYLSRRAVENRSVIQGAREERIMLQRELLESRLKVF